MMELKGKTVYVVLTEGAYPGNNLTPELFADEEEAKAYAAAQEAERFGNPPRQELWCEVVPLTIR
jgi:hypothetical protein